MDSNSQVVFWCWQIPIKNVSELILMLKKNTQFFHGISTMPSQVQHHFLGSSLTFDASTSFHPGFWLTFPSIFQSPFSHPKTLDLLFFSMSMVRIRNRWELGPATHFPKRSRLHPGHPWRRGRRRRVSPAGNGWRMHWTALKLKVPRWCPRPDGDGLNVLKAYYPWYSLITHI